MKDQNDLTRKTDQGPIEIIYETTMYQIARLTIEIICGTLIYRIECAIIACTMTGTLIDR